MWAPQALRLSGLHRSAWLPLQIIIWTNQIKSPFHLEFDFEPQSILSGSLPAWEAQISGLREEAAKHPVRARARTNHFLERVIGFILGV